MTTTVVVAVMWCTCCVSWCFVVTAAVCQRLVRWSAASRSAAANDHVRSARTDWRRAGNTSWGPVHK